jgi:hypothetical protein
LAEYPTALTYETLTKSSISIVLRAKIPVLNYATLKQSVAGVRVLYNEMVQTIVTEEIKTDFNDLVSSVGGTLGLFLGMSFLSLIEFVEIVMQSVLIFFAKTQHHSARVAEGSIK